VRARLEAAAAAVRADPFRPPRWLRGAHAQTLAGALLPRPRPPASHAFYVDTEPRTKVLCLGHALARARSRTTFVVVHGLGGSAASGHVLDVTRHALARGHAVVRFNMRSCGGTAHLSPTLYHANQTQDLRAVVEDVIVRRGARRIVLVGYSVGGNLVLNTLATWAGAPPAQVVGAVVLCPAIDIDASVARLDAPANAVYRRFFLRGLIELHAQKGGVRPAVRTVRDFDRLVTGPQAGFADVDAFYAWVSAASRLARVRVPTLLLHAEDDPMVELLPSTRATILANPALTMVESARGGHCGFTEAPSRRRRDGRWAADQIVRGGERLAGEAQG